MENDTFLQGTNVPFWALFIALVNALSDQTISEALIENPDMEKPQVFQIPVSEELVEQAMKNIGTTFKFNQFIDPMDGKKYIMFHFPTDRAVVEPSRIVTLN